MDFNTRQFCEQETVRLLPLIEYLARLSKIPLPVEDLIQEGAVAVFTHLPKFNPYRRDRDGRRIKVEAWLRRRIMGAFQDYARRHGRIVSGGQRHKRTDLCFSLDETCHVDDAGHPVTFAELLPARAERMHPRSAQEWTPLLQDLKPRLQAVLLEYFVRGRNHRQIAAMLGVSESRVSQLLSDVVGTLAELDRLDGRVRKVCA